MIVSSRNGRFVLTPRHEHIKISEPVRPLLCGRGEHIGRRLTGNASRAHVAEAFFMCPMRANREENLPYSIILGKFLMHAGRFCSKRL